jgi:hypothetical protein
VASLIADFGGKFHLVGDWADFGKGGAAAS